MKACQHAQKPLQEGILQGSSNPVSLPVQRKDNQSRILHPLTFQMRNWSRHQTAPQNRLFSDHRALIIDFDTAQLLGEALHFTKPKTRLLVLMQRKAMRQYHIKLDYRLSAQNVYQRATKLLAKYKKEKEHMPWMENQVEILGNYITTCRGDNPPSQFRRL
jgi:hypothetical protein